MVYSHERGPVTTAEADVLRLGPAVAQETVVVGSGAIEATLGADMRPRNDTDLVVSRQAFDYLRQQPGWTETRFPHGGPRLRNGQYDVGPDAWQDISIEELQERAWRTVGGVAIASLSDVYDWKQRGSLDTDDPKSVQDQRDLALIRDQLFKKPLPAQVMPGEIEFTRSTLPENLRDDPDAQVALALAANGLHIVTVLYGRAGRSHLLSAELELPEYRGRTYYHNRTHTADGMRRGQIHMTRLNALDEAAGRTPRFDATARLDALVSYGYHDGKYGGGRESDNPMGYDELESARIARAHAVIVGLQPSDRSGRIFEAIEDTGFDQQTQRQKGGGAGRSDLGRLTTGVDLQGISESTALIGSQELLLEDMTAQRQYKVFRRILGKVAIEHGVVLGPDPVDALQFIDDHADAKPADNQAGPTLKEAYVQGMAGNAAFIDPRTGYQFPDDWTGEIRAMRIDHADRARTMATKLATDQNYSTVDAYQDAVEHSFDMQQKYPQAFDAAN
jgi:hypothetical protein